MGPADYTMLISCFEVRHDHFVLYTSAAGLSNPGRGKRKEAENYQHAMQAERHAYRRIKRPILSQDEGMIRERSLAALLRFLFRYCSSTCSDRIFAQLGSASPFCNCDRV